jgi:hypothetical protein
VGLGPWVSKLQLGKIKKGNTILHLGVIYKANPTMAKTNKEDDKCHYKRDPLLVNGATKRKTKRGVRGGKKRKALIRFELGKIEPVSLVKGDTVKELLPGAPELDKMREMGKRTHAEERNDLNFELGEIGYLKEPMSLVNDGTDKELLPGAKRKRGPRVRKKRTALNKCLAVGAIGNPMEPKSHVNGSMVKNLLPGTLNLMTKREWRAKKWKALNSFELGEISHPKEKSLNCLEFKKRGPRVRKKRTALNNCLELGVNGLPLDPMSLVNGGAGKEVPPGAKRMRGPRVRMRRTGLNNCLEHGLIGHHMEPMSLVDGGAGKEVLPGAKRMRGPRVRKKRTALNNCFDLSKIGHPMEPMSLVNGDTVKELQTDGPKWNPYCYKVAAIGNSKDPSLVKGDTVKELPPGKPNLNQHCVDLRGIGHPRDPVSLVQGNTVKELPPGGPNLEKKRTRGKRTHAKKYNPYCFELGAIGHPDEPISLAVWRKVELRVLQQVAKSLEAIKVKKRNGDDKHAGSRYARKSIKICN